MVVYSVCLLFNVCLKCTYLLCVCLCMPYIQWYCLHLLCICLNNNKIAYINICLVCLNLQKTCTEDSKIYIIAFNYYHRQKGQRVSLEWKYFCETLKMWSGYHEVLFWSRYYEILCETFKEVVSVSLSTFVKPSEMWSIFTYYLQW